MPMKMKTHKGAAKRMKTTARGRVARTTAFHKHKLEVKSSRRKRQLRAGAVVSKADMERVQRLLPYGF